MIDNFKSAVGIIFLIFKSPHCRTAAEFGRYLRTYLIAAGSKIIFCSDRTAAAFSVGTPAFVTGDSTEFTFVFISEAGEDKFSVTDRDIF